MLIAFAVVEGTSIVAALVSPITNPVIARLSPPLNGLVFGLVDYGLPVAGLILFLCFLANACGKLKGLAPPRTEFTPGWTVGWFFVPIANFWKPYQAVREIWWASGPKTSRHAATPRGNWLLLIWWVFAVTFNALGLLLVLAGEAKMIDSLPLVASIALLGCGVLKEALGIAVLWSIYRRQKLRRKRLTESN